MLADAYAIWNGVGGGGAINAIRGKCSVGAVLWLLYSS
jgi:hypothetical protein